ncbi:Mitochondrial F1F0-ATP synthase, subunit b/ATP4 [Phaffia rhodozyma]|uniref:ATP synthase subunit 4 n=1 Tax=Phaffia rhodozyma TaxID=264483 RepID=A0A0F7SI46_PHARH|nr:Mitochondrial F1F0-ATP synthase, subunit b/ATP4 [Phaffia rhodozyma]
MASKLLSRSLRVGALRPAVVLPRATVARSYASKPTPEEKASSIIASVPSTSVGKTGTILAGVGAFAAAISQEIYVVNDETVILVAFAILATYIGKAASGPYAAWADSHIEKVKSILNDARERHKSSVQTRIDHVGELNDVVDVTKSMFALSKETARLEAENFTLRQQTALASEAKAVLDSWVRHEQAVRESQQNDLVKTVESNVLKQLENAKFKKDLVASAVADLEKLVSSKAI